MSKRLNITPASVEVMAHNKLIRTSPRKVNLVAKMIRGMSVGKALAVLSFCRKAVALDVKKVLQSAVSNAENNESLDVDLLTVKEAYVGKAIKLRRWHARAKGRGSPINKRYSKLTIVVCEVER